MYIKKIQGSELEKQKPNTPEDFFNRSEVVYVDEGVEKVLHVLYLRFFDEKMCEFTPYRQDPLFFDVTLKDLAALVCLIKNPRFRYRKRVYINKLEDFAGYFKDIDFTKFQDVFQKIEKEQGFELRTPLDFIVNAD